MAFLQNLPFSQANRHLLHLSLTAVFVFLLDQVTKAIVLTRFFPGEQYEVLANFLRVTLVFNEGGAFSTRLGSSAFYTATQVLVIAFVLYFLYRESGKEKIFDWALTLVVGGAMGNLTDRLRFGAVVDWIDVDFFDIHIDAGKFLFWNFPGYELLRWPVFNVADSAVTVAMVLIAAVLLLRRRKKPCYVSDQPYS